MTISSSNSEAAAEHRSKRRKAELALFSLEADRSRLEREQTTLATAVLSLRHALRQAELQVDEEQARLAKVEGEISAINSEIDRAKKTLRLL